MTVQVNHVDRVYDLASGATWKVNSNSGQIDIFNTSEELIATFLRWDNVRLIVNEPPKSEEVKFAEGIDVDDIVSAIGLAAKHGKRFFQ